MEPMIYILPKQKAPSQNGFTDEFLSEDKSRGNTFYLRYGPCPHTLLALCYYRKVN